MRNFLKLSVMVALSVVVGFGCGKSAKVNLTGLSENPAGSATEDGMKGSDGTSISGNEGLIPIANTAGYGEGGAGNLAIAPLDGLQGGAGATAAGAAGVAGAGINGQGGEGAWGNVADGLSGAVAGSRFIRDGKYWNEKVYFDYNRYEVRATERTKLDALYDHLIANPNFVVNIEGHCDERGSDEYNRSLSERRSLSVKQYLVSRGIAAERFETVSYGEDRPAIPNAQTERDHQLNRRAEFLIGLP